MGVRHALFVPPTSTYMKLGPADPAAAGGGSAAPDLAWQQSLRGVWEAQAAAAAAAARKQVQWAGVGEGAGCVGG